MAALQAGGEATTRKPSRDPTALTPAAEHQGSAGVCKERKGSASAPAAALTAPIQKSAAPPLVDVTVEDTATIDCGVCYHPLKRPIFQCVIGHMIRSPCHGKLQFKRKCHVCNITGFYHRCHGMEDLVESIRVPCPHAAHGCSMRLPYHDQESHGLVCPHAPCHCPGEACGFVGSTVALLDHFSCTHGWPCRTPRLRPFSVCLHDGFNFIGADEHGRKYLFLLNVVRHTFCRAVSVICIRPHSAAAKEIRFVLSYPAWSNADHQLVKHEQKAEYVEVPCSDLSGGLPDPSGSYQFIVPNHAGEDNDEHATKVMVDIITDNTSDQ